MSKCPNTPTDEEPDSDDADPIIVRLIQRGSRIFKLVKGKNGPTPFLPSKGMTGGEVNYIQNKEAMCLTERQADHIYKVIEKGDMINTKTMTCKTAQIKMIIHTRK